MPEFLGDLGDAIRSQPGVTTAVLTVSTAPCPCFLVNNTARVEVYMYEGVRRARTTPKETVLELPRELQTGLVPLTDVERVAAKVAAWVAAETPGRYLMVYPEWVPAGVIDALFTVTWGNGQLPVRPEKAPVYSNPVAICVAGGFRCLATCAVMLKRFVLDAYPAAKVFAMSWRDHSAREGVTLEAAEFYKQFMGDRLVDLVYFDDDAEAMAAVALREKEAAVYMAKVRPDSFRPYKAVDIHYRRRQCNVFMTRWCEANHWRPDAVLRARFDCFHVTTPDIAHVSETSCSAAVDLALWSTPRVATIVLDEFGLRYPELHAIALQLHGPKWELGSEVHEHLILQRAGVVVFSKPLACHARWTRVDAGPVGKWGIACIALRVVAQ
jgi:hypothetical protein